MEVVVGLSQLKNFDFYYSIARVWTSRLKANWNTCIGKFSLQQTIAAAQLWTSGIENLSQHARKQSGIK